MVLRWHHLLNWLHLTLGVLLFCQLLRIGVACRHKELRCVAVTTALPAPYCSPLSLFYAFHSRALSHALARASPCCSPSHVIVPSAHCFPMYLAHFDRHLETLVSTSCLQVSPHVLRSVDTSLNTCLSPALPVKPSSSLAAQRPARRSCLSRSSSPFRSTSSRNTWT